MQSSKFIEASGQLDRCHRGAALEGKPTKARVVTIVQEDDIPTPADQLWRGDPAQWTSTADATRRMAPGGTEADLRMRSSKPAGTSIDVIEEQPKKAAPPRLVRLAGSAIDVIEEQP